MPFWSNEACSYSSSVYFLSVQVSILWYYPAGSVALRMLTSTLRASDTWFKVFTLNLWHLIDSSRLTVLEIWWNKMILFDLKRSLVVEVSLSLLKNLPVSYSPLLMHVRESSLKVYQQSPWGEWHSIALCAVCHVVLQVFTLITYSVTAEWIVFSFCHMWVLCKTSFISE